MYYAIGDIHGEITLLKSLYSKILTLIEDTHDQNPVIVFLGDYVDRGEDSKAVLDFLMDLKDTDTLSHVFIKGNHEDLMIQASEGLKNNNSWPSRVWLQNGGTKTLQDSQQVVNALECEVIVG